MSNKSLKADLEKMGIAMTRKSRDHYVRGFAVNASAESLNPEAIHATYTVGCRVD